MDPMTHSWLSSSDAPTSLKITCLKMAMVVVATALDDFSTLQPPLVALLVFAVCFYQLVEVSRIALHDLHVAECWHCCITFWNDCCSEHAQPVLQRGQRRSYYGLYDNIIILMRSIPHGCPVQMALSVFHVHCCSCLTMRQSSTSCGMLCGAACCWWLPCW
jgi:hypothetical protein